MPTLAALTRSLTLPLNRTRSRRRRSNTSDEPSPTDDIPNTATSPLRPPLARRYNSFLGKLNALGSEPLSPTTDINADGYVIPRYTGADYATSQNVIFGKPLKESLKYASVQISTASSTGDLYVWGFIPVVVAKCGLYLKENATEVPGTFRVNGSNKRMRELQAAFETPPRYGKNLDWKKETYTTHDVASVFRRYLTQMPEPVIPYDLYHKFRDAVGKEPYNEEEIIAKFKSLIRQMPRANQYLLLYVLDLLSVFARKSNKNLMNATNLAVIFRPGLISHPDHEMSPQEHALSQKVLEFMIAHQDWFMLEVPPAPVRKDSAQHPTSPQHRQRGSDQFTSSSLPSNSPLSQPQPSQSLPNPNSNFSPLHQHSHQYHPTANGTIPPTNQHNAGGPQHLSSPSVVATVGHGHGYNGNVNVSSHRHNNSPVVPRGTSPRPFSEFGSEVDDVMIIPNTAEVEMAGVGGGWRPVSHPFSKDKEKERIKMLRRRTTMDRSDLQTGGSILEENEVAPSPADPDSPINTRGHPVTVQRSRTLPSQRQKSREVHHTSGELVLSASTGKENIGHVFFGVKDIKDGKEGKRTVLVKKNRRASSNIIEKTDSKEKERT